MAFMLMKHILLSFMCLRIVINVAGNKRTKKLFYVSARDFAIKNTLEKASSKLLRYDFTISKTTTTLSTGLQDDFTDSI